MEEQIKLPARVLIPAHPAPRVDIDPAGKIVHEIRKTASRPLVVKDFFSKASHAFPPGGQGSEPARLSCRARPRQAELTVGRKSKPHARLGRQKSP